MINLWKIALKKENVLTDEELREFARLYVESKSRYEEIKKENKRLMEKIINDNKDKEINNNNI